MEECFVKTVDNVKIAFNHYKIGSESLVIVLHGWFMTKDSFAFSHLSEHFAKNFDVITLDFRGHGKSGGFYTFTSKEINDIQSVIDIIKNDYKYIYLIGFSLGASLALIYSSTSDYINKVIAVSPASDFDKIENNFWRKNAWLPTLQKFELNRWLSIRPCLPIHKKIKPIDIIQNVKCPTLFIAGKNDVTVYPWHTKLLFGKAICDKEYVLFEDGKHAEDLFLEDEINFLKICYDWLNG